MLAALVLAAIWKFGVPWIELTLNTVSTDDAYVNGHVTFVAARVGGQIARVFVDDNNRIHKGDVLAQLDKEPYEDEVAVKRAAVDTAKADLQAATAAVRALEAQARSQHWKLQYAMQNVDNRVAVLNARVAALDKSNATLKLAQLEFARAEQLLPSGTISRAGVRSTACGPFGIAGGSEASLGGCPPNPCLIGLAGTAGKRRISVKCRPISIRLSLPSGKRRRRCIQTAAQLGVIHSYEQLPKQMIEQFEKLDQGDVDRALAGLTANAPAVKRRKPSSKRPIAISFRPNSTFVTVTLSLRLMGS